MNQIYLDAVGIGFFVAAFLLGLLFIFAIILLEAFLMFKLKYHPFKKSLLQSTIINLVSLVAGIVMYYMSYNFFRMGNIAGFITFLVTTLIIEGLILFLLNRQKPLAETAKVCLVINIVSYAVACLLSLALGDYSI